MGEVSRGGKDRGQRPALSTRSAPMGFARHRMMSALFGPSGLGDWFLRESDWMTKPCLSRSGFELQTVCFGRESENVRKFGRGSTVSGLLALYKRIAGTRVPLTSDVVRVAQHLVAASCKQVSGRARIGGSRHRAGTTSEPS